VFTSDREGDEALFWLDASAGAAERLVKVEQGIVPQAEAWSPDGKLLIFTNRTGPDGAGQNLGISTWSVGTDEKPALIIKPPASNASLSPDGKWLAYQGRGEVYVEPFPPTGEKHQMTTNGGDNPLWSPDGKQLFFLRHDIREGPTRQVMVVDIQTQSGFTFSNVTALPIEGLIATGPRPYDITPDGMYFLVIVPKAQDDGSKWTGDQLLVTLNWFTELQQRVPTR
jgi:Tol biopolymer transport system component